MSVEITPIPLHGGAVRVVGPREWGTVTYAGPSHNGQADWLAQLAVYQRRAAHGKLKRPRHLQRPRYRRVGKGFYPTKQEAIDALIEVVDVKQWATVPTGEYTVPLIGVPKEATEEKCSKCGATLHLTNTVLSGDGKPLCTTCQPTS